MKEKMRVNRMPLLKSLDWMSICSLERLLKYQRMPARIAVMLKSQPKSQLRRRMLHQLLQLRLRPRPRRKLQSHQSQK